MARGKRRSWRIKKLKQGSNNLIQTESISSKPSKTGFYDTYYKGLVFIPITILIISIFVLTMHTIHQGTAINLGIQLKGGASLIVKPIHKITALNLEQKLSKQFPKHDFIVRELSKTTGTELSIETTATGSDLDIVKQALNTQGFEILSSQSISSSLGVGFFKQAIKAIIIAFLLMAVVVFIYFRVFVPSFAVVFTAFSDIVITLAVTTLVGIRLNTPGVAAVLMLIGYSVDTDILLSTRLLKEKQGTLNNRLLRAFKTGITMTLTTLAAVIIALFITSSPVIKDIMSILLIGLLVDITNTWLQNAGILKWYLNIKTKHKP